ncbi:MAG TPA: DPP IV N-terminal domain-containing protein [Geothrix sp.]|nr:DPP IV N-terminal domain-containing protein [Geothrix sp.]
MLIRALPASLLLLASLSALGSDRITLEGLAHPTKRIAYVGMPSTRLEWLPDGALLQTKREGTRASLVRVDPQTWEQKPLLDSSQAEKALVAAGATEGAAKAAMDRGRLIWNDAHSAFLVTVGEDLFLMEVQGSTAKRLPAGKLDEPAFSPDGTQVAYLRGNDLYRVDLASGLEARLTVGGSETVFNGRLDWVYQEEVYGRDDFRAFWWAPDSKRIAYLSLDESKVPVFTLVDDRTQPQQLHRARYPKVGDPNPIARLGIVDLAGRTTWTQEAHPNQEILITRVTWDTRGRLLAIITDRAQTWLELRRFEGDGSRELIKEQGRPWQDPHRQDPPVFLKDGGFLWESTRTGRRHIYRFDAEGAMENPVTFGEWDVRRLHGVNEATGLVYFDGTKDSPIATQSYRAALDGSGLTRVTEGRGTHAVRWNKAYSAFLDTWSNLDQPAKQALFDGSGKQLRMIDDNANPRLKELKLGTIKLQQVKTRDGFRMETMLVLPPDFDPRKKYPVFQHIYGGPETPQVMDMYNRGLMWYHFLAQNGIIVWICDNRSASNKGQASVKGIYKRLGAQELEDQLDGLKWLGEQGFADLSRVCIEGWSYGGFMSAYSMTHSTAYKLGIIGAPVTNFALYDSIYTERYMGLLADNKAGYEGTNLAAAAKNFSGKALIMHGLLDDNVHPQNTVQFIDALQKAEKDFELRIYPGSDHVSAFGKPWQNWDIIRARWEFISKNL